MRVAVDATTGNHDVVRIRRYHAAQRNVIDVIVGKLLPVYELLGIVQLDPPGTPGRRVRWPGAFANVIDGQLPLADDPPRLSQARIAVRSDAGVGKDVRILGTQKPYDVVRLA